MKITFDHISPKNQNIEMTGRNVPMTQKTKGSSYQVAFDGKERVGFGTNEPNKGKNILPQPSEGVEAQVQNMRDQLTVLSHTMSDEDFAKMQEQGYDPAEMEPEEAVTILDKIKAELLKSGEHIVGYTDDINMTTLTEAVGSTALAEALVSEFAQKDIPLERQNIEQVVWALDIAGQLESPTQNTYYYMAANEMPATLKNFYLAQGSGSRLELEQSSQYFGEAVKGYVTKNVSENKTDTCQVSLDMPQELDRLMERLGMENATQEEVTAASWLVERGLPVDVAAIERTRDMLSVSFPLEPEHVVKVVAAAIAEKIPAGDKNLTEDTTYIEKAVAVYEYYQGDGALERVQNRAKLEEVRLFMTIEANLKLLKSGFSIDTSPIEETIEALKEMEKKLAEQYFPQDDKAQVKYEQYRETSKLLKDLPILPLVTVGKLAGQIQTVTLTEFHAEGTQLARAYKEAGERYETVWTAPRADMGDSIRKAFANVDAILKDLQYEATEENRKAIRTLAYNQMELREENIELVKVAQSKVDSVIQKMTPAATLRMIRDGLNPLEATLTQLEQYFDELPEEYTQSAEKYSKFLYQLEQTGEISKQERESFIGCYRLLHQIEKSDGAVIGALVNVGGEVNFKNLLMAARTGKMAAMDVRVNDALGALSEEAVDGYINSISEQIRTAYTKEQADAYRQQSKEAAKAPKEAFEMLERGDLDASTRNILAAKVLEQESNGVLNRYPERTKKQERSELYKKLAKKEIFTREYSDDLTEALESVEEATIQESNGMVDVREMQLLHKQLTILNSLSANEEYYIPMEIDGELTSVHLQFEHNEALQGMVRIALKGSRLGDLCGTLQVTQDTVDGFFIGNNRETVMKLKESSDIINTSLGEEWKSCRVEFVYSEAEQIPMDWTRRSVAAQVSTDSLYRLSGSFLEALKTVGDATEKR